MRRTFATAVRTTAPLAALFAVLALGAPAYADAAAVTALKQFGEPAFKPGFTHFPHANPNAPKGGAVTLAAQGSFDSLNPIILRGVTPRTLGLVSDSLMVGSGWELDAAYGALAERVEVPDDKSWATFHLRKEARWHDGVPLTAGDVVFAWDSIQAHGSPFLKSFLDRVATVEALDDHRLKITLKTTGEIKPIIDFATSIAPQPKHWWTANGRDIAKTTLEPILGSGPYRIRTVDPGRSITFERVPDYWGKDLPVARGFNNFDTVKVDYYRDDDVMFEAFKAGAYDFRTENRAQRWTTGYDFPAIKDGRVARRAVKSELPLGAQGFRLNTRRAKFADPRVREALGYLFDFEWIQKNILYGQYSRTTSNFPNSDFGAKGPPSPAELALLEPFRGKIPERAFTDTFEPPKTDGSGNNRANVREATRLFREAGWELKNGKLTNAKTGEAMSIEFLDGSGGLTRVVQPYVEALRKVGIDATLRLVDTAQYQARTDEFDFDVVVANFNFFTPPGTELRSYFGSAAADIKGSANYAGIREPAADALIDRALAAKDLDSVQAATRALDRVLLWGFYMIPHWYNPENWVAYKTKLAFPDTPPKYDLGFRNTGFPDTWWVQPGKEG
ncbi:extracellular solute-binding protein [Azospirillum rugosum]|uniref:Microcin C transport system substrate-binding protein n=1 Tax=Azospirillum rugosum TaxID=416170 RepID=A0ABS4SRJ0_9PROT|nr:extracellular solute-binding protein [Azospirillum rugosum]MBP2295179.1 microcin C transport system substrate-binding protein [Azospirillum rugosum]MDQ0528553.1 microcin C transport system substrate-binding protein [Azospirillum rugosum]